MKPAANTIETLLFESDVSDLLKLSISWVQKARGQGIGPKFIKVGGAVRYRLSDVQEFLEERVRKSTSDSKKGGLR